MHKTLLTWRIAENAGPNRSMHWRWSAIHRGSFDRTLARKYRWSRSSIAA